MGYIYAKTNKIRLICYDLISNQIYKDLTFNAIVSQEIKDESKEYRNLNNEIVIDDIGQRMIIKATILNNFNAFENNQNDIIDLIDAINKVKSGFYRFKVYPNYVENCFNFSLDLFDCIVTNRYKIKNLHNFVNAGHNIIIELIEAIPNKNFVPKVLPIPTQQISILQQNKINGD